MYTKTTWEDKIDGVSDGTELNAENLNNIEVGIAQAHLYDETTNVGNAYSVSIDSSIDSLAKLVGVPVRAKMNADSTDAITLNVNTLGAKAVKKGNGSDFTNAKNESIYTYIYNGTSFFLQGSDSSGNAAAADVRAGKTASNNEGEFIGEMDLTNKTAANIKVGVTIDGTTGEYPSITAGDVELYVNATEHSVVSGDAWTKKVDIDIALAGTYRIKFKLKLNTSGSYAKARVYKNGSAFGTERLTDSLSYVEYTEDLIFAAGDNVQLYLYAFSGYTTYTSDFKISTSAGSIFTIVL